MERPCEKSQLVQILLENSNSPLFHQLMQIGQQMEALHEKLSRTNSSDHLMIQCLALSSYHQICWLYFLTGRTDAIEFSGLSLLEE